MNKFFISSFIFLVWFCCSCTTPVVAQDEEELPSFDYSLPWGRVDLKPTQVDASEIRKTTPTPNSIGVFKTSHKKYTEKEAASIASRLGFPKQKGKKEYGRDKWHSDSIVFVDGPIESPQRSLTVLLDSGRWYYSANGLEEMEENYVFQLEAGKKLRTLGESQQKEVADKFIASHPALFKPFNESECKVESIYLFTQIDVDGHEKEFRYSYIFNYQLLVEGFEILNQETGYDIGIQVGVDGKIYSVVNAISLLLSNKRVFQLDFDGRLNSLKNGISGLALRDIKNIKEAPLSIIRIGYLSGNHLEPVSHLMPVFDARIEYKKSLNRIFVPALTPNNYKELQYFTQTAKRPLITPQEQEERFDILFKQANDEDDMVWKTSFEKYSDQEYIEFLGDHNEEAQQLWEKVAGNCPIRKRLELLTKVRQIQKKGLSHLQSIKASGYPALPYEGLVAGYLKLIKKGLEPRLKEWQQSKETFNLATEAIKGFKEYSSLVQTGYFSSNYIKEIEIGENLKAVLKNVTPKSIAFKTLQKYYVDYTQLKQLDKNKWIKSNKTKAMLRKFPAEPGSNIGVFSVHYNALCRFAGIPIPRPKKDIQGGIKTNLLRLLKQKQWETIATQDIDYLLSLRTKVLPGVEKEIERELSNIETQRKYKWGFDAKDARKRQDAAAGRYGLKTKHTKHINKQNQIDFMIIPKGKFVMGGFSPGTLRNSNANPVHVVELSKDYFISAFEITEAQWTAVMGDLPEKYSRGPDFPVSRISWLKAKEFCVKLSKELEGVVRLPTEAEWEYACRAGVEGNWYWKTAEASDYENLVNAKGRDLWKGNNPAPVGRLKPNPFGLYDTIGNVREFCEDTYGKNFFKTSPLVDPINKQASEDRVIRGHGLYGTFECYARKGVKSSEAIENVGFRVVLEVPELKQRTE